MRRILLGAAAAVVAAGCSRGGPAHHAVDDGCERAFVEVLRLTDGNGSANELSDARGATLSACRSAGEWKEAARSHPGITNDRTDESSLSNELSRFCKAYSNQATAAC